jgi:2-polyprenyl-3-methyl-5-hydroxy-6-metoxy-1,4-benzoquinol methylase
MIERETEATRLVFEPAPMFRKTALQDDSETALAGGKRIAILIVTYNAASTLMAVLKRITPNVWRNVEEVVVFDDASNDVTYEAAIGLKTLLHLPKLRVIKHEKNLGYGGNQKAGYRYLIERGFDIVVLLHGDGQYAPEILSHLYAPLVRGEADAVFGSRMMRTYGGPLQGGMPLYKYVGNRILTTLENWVLGMKLTEFHSGYRAYSLATLKRIEMENMTSDFHFDTEIIIKLKHQGFRIKEVPIPTYYGGEICRVNGMQYAGDVVRAVWRYRRTVASARPFPEFEEYWARYPLKVARYSSHGYVMRIVRGALDVLDIGCGHGYLSARLSEGGCRVTGVDVLPEPERLAAMEAYVQCDLARGMDDALGQLRVQGYDRVLLLDVLEHLPEAEQILQHARDLLKQDGQIVVSLPNVANFTMRMMLFLGRWNYTDRGILDKSHLHFYTRKTGRKLLEQNGFEIVKQWMTIVPIELVLGMKPETRTMRWASACLHAATLLLPGLLGYQMMFVARKGSTKVANSLETPVG